MSGGVADTLQEIKSAIASRVANPLVGSFSLSWILVNYRFLITLFSDKSVAWRFGYIDTVLYPGWGCLLAKWLVMPAVLTYAYLRLLPMLSKPVYDFVLRTQKEMADIKRRSDGAQLMSLEEKEVVLDAASKQEAEAVRLKDKADIVMREADIKLRQSEATAAEGDLRAKEVMDAAEKKLAQRAHEMTGLRHDLIDERFMNAASHLPDEAKARIEQYLFSQEFVFRFQYGGSSHKGEVSFQPEGAILVSGISSEFVVASWSVENGRLHLNAQGGADHLYLSFSKEERFFTGKNRHGPAWVVPTRPI